MAHTSNNKKLTKSERKFQELEDKIAKLEKNLKQLQEFTLKFFVNTHKLPEQN